MRKPGNHGVQGAKGRSGRKSAYQELADAVELNKLFFEPQSINELKKQIKKGTYPLKSVFVVKAFAGSEKVLLKIFDKVFPD